MTGSQSREPALMVNQGLMYLGELGGTAEGSKPLPQVIWGGGFFLNGIGE